MIELTKREQEVYSDIMTGMSIKSIAAKYIVSYQTIKTHVKNLYQKFGVSERYELMAIEIKKLKGLKE